MLSRKKWTFGFLLTLLALALFIDARPQKCADTICAERHSDAPTYGLPGAFPVGIRDLETNDEPSLALKMWYPALAAAGAQINTAEFPDIVYAAQGY